jgi:restriction endonuclease S subunit
MSAEFDQYVKQMETLEKQKQGIIEKILSQRRELDAQLEQLGYTDHLKTSKKGGRPKGSKNTQKRTSKKVTADS